MSGGEYETAQVCGPIQVKLNLWHATAEAQP